MTKGVLVQFAALGVIVYVTVEGTLPVFLSDCKIKLPDPLPAPVTEP